MKRILSLFLILPFFSCSQPVPQPGFMVHTFGQLPFLEYGLGDDRLGGAKMGFLDSNVVLTVVDSAGTDYKVQLSRYHSAYIAKESVAMLPVQDPKPYHLSSNWKVYGDTAFDYVVITLDEKLPYASRQLLDPSRIELDIFGATSNTNWITQLSTTREIKNVWYQQTEDDVLRATIELNHPQHWGYSVRYDTAGCKLILRIKRQPATADIRQLRIAIDAGHGGTNGGAGGVTTRIAEKEYTLLFAKQLESTLREAGVEHVLMTRTKDTTLGMPERIEMLRKFDPHLLISIHLNSSSIDTVKGVSTYYRYIGFRPLSVAILKQMISMQLAEYGNVGNFNFGLSGPTDYPNCLVEVAFLSNKEDEKKIIDPAFRKAVANRIYMGITDWLKALQ